MKLGFIGLGVMGAPMAAHLVAAGHDVSGYDVTPAAGEKLRGKKLLLVVCFRAADDMALSRMCEAVAAAGGERAYAAREAAPAAASSRPSARHAPRAARIWSKPRARDSTKCWPAARRPARQRAGMG